MRPVLRAMAVRHNVVELLAGAQHRALAMLSAATLRPHIGLSVAARSAKKNGMLSLAKAKQLVRLDEAAHWARHATEQRLEDFLSDLSSVLGQAGKTAEESETCHDDTQDLVMNAPSPLVHQHVNKAPNQEETLLVRPEDDISSFGISDNDFTKQMEIEESEPSAALVTDDPEGITAVARQPPSLSFASPLPSTCPTEQSSSQRSPLLQVGALVNNQVEKEADSLLQNPGGSGWKWTGSSWARNTTPLPSTTESASLIVNTGQQKGAADAFKSAPLMLMSQQRLPAPTAELLAQLAPMLRPP